MGVYVTSAQPTGLVGEVVRIAELAAARIMGIYGGAFTATGKADGSPLTAADLASHEAIVAGLSALPLGFPILSEEARAVCYPERRGWPVFWLVDPLDGTREFIDRNGDFTVNIALIHEGLPVLGVVCAPALEVTYWAARGHGAFVRRASDPPRRIGVDQAGGVLRVAVSRSHAGAELPAFLERLGPHAAVPVGSSLKICMVAEGNADLYPRLGPTSEWDIAAAHCVLEEAGGILTTTDGSAFVYNKEEILNPPFFAAGSQRAHDAALEARD
jgi:3'(2'), 5'-bisphosphate nucleotidase